MTMNFNRNGGSGTNDYPQLNNKPQINGVTLIGNKTSSDLGLMPIRNVDLKPTKDSQNFVFSGGVYEADEKIKSSIEGMDTVYTEDGTPVDLPSYDVIEETEMQFEPTQDLHGYDKPWAGGAGKNKLPLTVNGIKNDNTSGTWSGNVYTLDGATFEILVDSNNNVQGIKSVGVSDQKGIYLNLTLEAGTYTLSSDFTEQAGANDTLITLGLGGQVIARGNSNPPGSTFTLESASQITWILRRQTSTEITCRPMVRLSTETGADFEPYSNICPISGQNNATLADEYDNKYIASLGGTYYGGRVFFETSFYNQFWEYIASYNGETLPREWISDRDEYIAGTTPTIGAEVAYRLDTTIGHRISVTREPLARGEITYNGSALYISYQKDNVIGECKKFTVDEIAKLGLPQPPTTDGTYHLECSVSGGIPTITWVLNS